MSERGRQTMSIRVANKTNIEKACNRLDEIKNLFKEIESEKDRGNECGMSRESLMLKLHCENKRTIDYNYNQYVNQKINELLDEIEALHSHVYYAALSRGKYLKTIKYGDSNLEDLYNKEVDKEIKQFNNVLAIIRRPSKITTSTTGDDSGGNEGTPEPCAKNKKKGNSEKTQDSKCKKNRTQPNFYDVPKYIDGQPQGDDCEFC